MNWKTISIQLRKNLLGSILSIVAVGIGVSVLCLVLSLTLAITRAADAPVTKLDPNTLQVTLDIGPMLSESDYLTNGDLKALGRLDDSILQVITPPDGGVGTDAMANGVLFHVYEMGPALPRMDKMLGLQMITGGYFSSRELDSAPLEALVSTETAKTIFGTTSVLGKSVYLGGVYSGVTYDTRRRFKIIGVFKNLDQQQQHLFSCNPGFLVPQQYVVQAPGISSLLVEVRSGKIEQAESEIRLVLQARHGRTKQYLVRTLPEALNADRKSLRDIAWDYTKRFGVVGFAILLVGTFGIFSMTLVGILERTRQIGLLRSLGATCRNILCLFVEEALFITMVGSGIGILAANALMPQFLALLKPDWGSVIIMYSGQSELAGGLDPRAAMVSLLIALLLGGLAAMVPAISVLRNSPIESMRD